MFRDESESYLPPVDPFSVIEHLTDTPPTCLPLNSDSRQCSSSINIDRDTHVIRTGLTRWYYECCCRKWYFISDILKLGLTVLNIKWTLHYCMYSTKWQLITHTKLEYQLFLNSPTSCETLSWYYKMVIIICDFYFNMVISCISLCLKMLFDYLHTSIYIIDSQEWV